MTYNSDLRRLNQEFRKWFSNNLEPSEEELLNWLKYYYIEGRRAIETFLDE